MSKKILRQKQRGTAAVPARLKIINKKQRHAVLATVSGTRPYTSLVAFALTPDAKNIIFATPKKTQKYKNILKNKNVSLLIHTAKNTSKDYANAEAVTIQGTTRAVIGKRKKELTGVLAGKHPDLKSFINSATTAIIKVKVEYCLHVNSFQQITEWRVS
jgi:nitroimidazol reductase NimA-like FMN-containing flavoprotein (pyridoxamine 5'-phosphate oxidase superfamily)